MLKYEDISKVIITIIITKLIEKYYKYFYNFLNLNQINLFSFAGFNFVESKNYNFLLESPSKYNFGDEKINKINISEPLLLTIENFLINQLIIYPYSSKESIILSLSGGVDSMVILACLISIRDSLNTKSERLTIYACMIDYNGRPESNYEVEFLKEFCKNYNVEIFITKINKNKFKKYNSNNNIKNVSKKNYEETSKEIRFRSYLDLINKFGSNGIILGSDQDDVIENIFINTLNGNSILDLEILKKFNKTKMLNNNFNIYRPLIDVCKNDIKSFANKFNIPYFIDTTPKWSKRGKVRNKVFPLIENIYNGTFKQKLKDIGRQSNELNRIIYNSIILPWKNDIIINNNDSELFLIPVKFKELILWEALITVLFEKLNLIPIKKKTIENLVSELSNLQSSTKKIQLENNYYAIINNISVKIIKK